MKSYLASLVFVLLVNTGESFSQLISQKQFLDSASMPSDSVSARYYRVYQYTDSSHNSGVERNYFRNGKIRSEIVYKNILGNEIGLCTYYSYYKDGGLKRIFSKLNDSLQGPSREYYPTGELKRDEYYENDKLLSAHCFKTDGSDMECFGKVVVQRYVKAEFPGGEEEMKRFIYRTMIYPRQALKWEISGTVVVSCMIDTSGNVTDISILGQDTIEVLNAESIRIVSLMPQWTPAKLYGELIRSQVIIPIRFRLEYED